MTVVYKLRSGSVIAPPGVSRTPLILGTCRDGDASEAYVYDPGAEPADDLGPGRATALARLLLAAGARVVVVPVAPTYQALPAVTKTGDGPTVSLALTSAGVGPHDDARLLFTVLPGATSVSLAYDGSTVAEAYPIPPELPAVLRGAGNVTNGADLEGAIVDIDAPVDVTVTFLAGSRPASTAGLHAALATSASTVTLTAADLLTAGKAEILAYPRRLEFTTSGGTAGDAPADVVITGTLAGAPVTETLALSQTAGSVTSSYEYDTITSLAYAAGQGTGAFVAIGYSSRYVDAAEIATALTALLVAASAGCAARVHDDADGQHIEIVSTAVGGAASLLVPDAPYQLDIPAASVTGDAATIALDWLGVTVAFAAGTYVEGTTYAATVAGPTATAAATLAALNVGMSDHINKPFGFVVPSDTPASMSSTRGLWDALVARIDAKQIDGADPVLSYLLCPTALHTASATAATNRANIRTADDALILAFAGSAKKSHHRVTGDGYIAGLSEMPGSHRRPAVWAAADAVVRIERTAGNPADQKSLACSMTGPDGLTKARDERFASVKFGGMGNSFACWALKTAADGSALFCPSASAAGATSTLRSPGAIAIAWAMGRAIMPQLVAWEGTWPTDPVNPAAANPDLIVDREAQLFELIAPAIWPGEQGAENLDTINVSGTPVVSISAPNIKNDGQWSVGIAWNDLAVAESCTVTLTPTTAALGAAGA